ncbi:hypothetical protein [Achromobacter sp.]|uniref:hypothetical protein n=1 Tax=Achromobacter sp. TaxID=134375 RepID=UPI0028A8478F|nr:hypothetical protein [Achromobacter sp.]
MIGWWIIVSTGSPEERDRATPEARRAAILAQWETGAGGIDWIEHLTQVRKAAKYASGGYPNRYAARARDVLPLIEGGGILPSKDGVWIFGIDEGEEYAQPPGWIGKVQVHADRVAACSPDQILTIDAWDQS